MWSSLFSFKSSSHVSFNYKNYPEVESFENLLIVHTGVSSEPVELNIGIYAMYQPINELVNDTIFIKCVSKSSFFSSFLKKLLL